MLGRTLLAGALVLGSVVAGDAATGVEKCHAKKLKLAGIHAACRLKTDAKAVLAGEAPDYAKCDDAIATKFEKTEQKAGLGTCPTEGDAGAIAAILEQSTGRVGEQLEAPDVACPPGYRDRSPVEVVTDWLDAYGSENVPLLLCNYHPSAYILDDQGILFGYGDIASAYSSLWSLFSGVNPTILQITEFESSIRMLSTLDAGWVEMQDGIDTFEIENGRIRRQNRHGLITFNGPPPEQN